MHVPDEEEQPADARQVRDRSHVVAFWWLAGVAISVAFLVAFVLLAAGSQGGAAPHAGSLRPLAPTPPGSVPR